jgi:hypothetical protein
MRNTKSFKKRIGHDVFLLDQPARGIIGMKKDMMLFLDGTVKPISLPY